MMDDFKESLVEIETKLKLNQELQQNLHQKLECLARSYESLEIDHVVLDDLGPGANLILQKSLETYAVTNRMSQSIRNLDAEQGRVLGVIQLLGRIERIHELMHQLDKPNAERSIQDLSSFPPSTISAYEARFVGSKVNEKMEASKQRCQEEALQALNSTPNDPTLASQILHKLSLIDRLKEGLVCYAEHLTCIAESKLGSIVNAGSEQESMTLAHARRLAKILETGSELLKFAFVDVLGGLEGAREHAHLLQHAIMYQIELASGDVVEAFSDYSSSITRDTSQIYPLDVAISESILMLQHIERFKEHLSMKLSLESTDCLEDATKRLKDVYSSDERDYVQLGLKKAMELDQYIEEDRLGSCVDDTFFVCRKVISRSFKNCNVKFVQESLKDIFLAALTKVTRSSLYSTDTVEKKRSFVTAVNNLMAALTTLEDLIAEFSLEDWDETKVEFEAAAQSAIQSLYKSLLKSKYMALVDATVSKPEAEDLAQKFIPSLTKLLSQLSLWVTSETDSALGKLLISEFNSSWIQSILKTRFTQWSAFQLDRQIRTIAVHFADKFGVAWKQEQFGRLLEIASVLISESREEASTTIVRGIEMEQLLELRSDW